jgi:hypothetical protein
MVESACCTSLYRKVEGKNMKTSRSFLLPRTVVKLPCTGASHVSGSANPRSALTSNEGLLSWKVWLAWLKGAHWSFLCPCNVVPDFTPNP